MRKIDVLNFYIKAFFHYQKNNFEMKRNVVEDLNSLMSDFEVKKGEKGRGSLISEKDRKYTACFLRACERIAIKNQDMERKVRTRDDRALY